MQLFELPLIEVKKETPTVSSFLFEKHPSFIYQPGQFVRLFIEIDGVIQDRSFSIASSPTEPYLMLTMRHSDKPFKYILAKKKKGDRVTVSPPQGKFILQTDTTKQIVFIAGGIGITPFRSMLTFLYHTQSSLPLTLLYSSRSEDEIVFKKELEELTTNLPNLSLTHTLTRSDTWSGKKGRITKEDVEKFITPKEDTLFYICGLPTMVIDMTQLLRTLAVPSENVRFELFTGY
jgi:ferredoxin-NADP reductase